MIDITHKSTTLRQATAQAIVRVSRAETIEAIKNRTVPKGDVFEMAKAAGLLGVKKTADLLPDCHPMPIEQANIEYSIDGLEVTILMHVKTIYKTGVEVEAMHGASVVALTIYDMLKPIDKEIEITNLKLIKKKGGKSQYMDKLNSNIKAAVIVCSDSVSAGKKQDAAGKAIIGKLEKLQIPVGEYIIIPDEIKIIQENVLMFCKNQIDLIILTGGTGLSPRDVTPEAIRPLLDREIPGIAEAVRNYGQEQMPYAMLSRSIAGLKGNTLILALPGSTRGASESMDALFPYLLHIFKVMLHIPHD